MTMIMECENQRYEDNENAREVLGMTMRELKSVRAQLILAKEVALEATMVLAEVSPKKEVSLELEKLKEENEKLKTENEKLEGGIELCSDLLDQFHEGDILEYASDCYGFHDIVEGSTPYIELQEELDIAKTENEKLKTENEKLEGGIELCSDLLDQFHEGDILEYASDCYGFHDIVEGSTPYIELKEELELTKKEFEKLKRENIPVIRGY